MLAIHGHFLTDGIEQSRLDAHQYLGAGGQVLDALKITCKYFQLVIIKCFVWHVSLSPVRKFAREILSASASWRRWRNIVGPGPC